MRKKDLLIIGAISAIVAGVSVIIVTTKKHRKLLKTILFDIKDEVEEVEEWCDEINDQVNDIRETLEEMRNHTDDIASCVIEIKDQFKRREQKWTEMADKINQPSKMISDDEDKEPAHWTIATPKEENTNSELFSPAGPM